MDRMHRIKTKKHEKGTREQATAMHEKTSNGNESIRHTPHVITLITAIAEP